MRKPKLYQQTSNTTLVYNKILDSQDFDYTSKSKTIDGKIIEINNYEYSRIRSWLNDTFYNTAFNELEQKIILNTLVDNSAASTKDLKNIYAYNNYTSTGILPALKIKL